jgi:glycosyltransferase involved in cell wall biosynthesis
MVTGAYHPEVSGGAVQCRNLILALRGAVSFAVVTTTRDTSLPRRGQVDGVPVWRIPLSTGSLVERLRAVVLLIRALLFSDWRYRILHLHGFSSKTVLAILAAKVVRKHVLLVIHTAGQDEMLTQSARPFGRLRVRVYEAADRFVAVSPAFSSRYLASGLPESKLAEIPNGVDTTRFRPPRSPQEKATVRARLGLPRDVPVVLFVGFFSKDKGPHRVIEAWLQARERGAHSFLVLVGSTDTRYVEIDGALVTGVRQLMANPLCRDDVRLVEHTLEMEAYYQAADLFVLPSLREGCPLSLLEAMATGLPCVVSRLPGATDVLIEHDVNGVLIPIGDVEALTRNIVALIQEPQKRAALGRRARAGVEAKYSVERMASAYRECYRSLLGACAGVAR